MARGKISLKHLYSLNKVSEEMKRFLTSGKYTNDTLRELRRTVKEECSNLPHSVAVHINGFIVDNILDLCDESIEIDCPILEYYIPEISYDDIILYHQALAELYATECVDKIFAQVHSILSKWELYVYLELIPLLNV